MPKVPRASPFPLAPHPDPDITGLQGTPDKPLPTWPLSYLACEAWASWQAQSMLGASDFAWQTAQGTISRTGLPACRSVLYPPVLGKGDLLLNSHLVSGPLRSQGSAWDNLRCVLLHLFVDLVLYCSNSWILWGAVSEKETLTNL